MPYSCVSRISAAISAGSPGAGMFIRTHGRSAAGGWAKDAAVSGVTGLNLIHSALWIAASCRFWASEAAPNRAKAAAAARMAGFSIGYSANCPPRWRPKANSFQPSVGCIGLNPRMVHLMSDESIHGASQPLARHAQFRPTFASLSKFLLVFRINTLRQERSLDTGICGEPYRPRTKFPRPLSRSEEHTSELQ